MSLSNTQRVREIRQLIRGDKRSFRKLFSADTSSGVCSAVMLSLLKKIPIMLSHHFFKIRLARLDIWNAEKALGLWFGHFRLIKHVTSILPGSLCLFNIKDYFIFVCITVIKILSVSCAITTK